MYACRYVFLYTYANILNYDFKRLFAQLNFPYKYVLYVFILLYTILTCIFFRRTLVTRILHEKCTRILTCILQF